MDKDETLARIIFCPYHIKRGKDQLKPSAMRPAYGTGDVSVHRLRIVTPQFCRCLGVDMARGRDDREYQGLGLVSVENVFQVGAQVRDTPQERMPGHADISYDYIPKRGEPIPARVHEQIKKLTKLARFIRDPDPAGLEWQLQLAH